MLESCYETESTSPPRTEAASKVGHGSWGTALLDSRANRSKKQIDAVRAGFLVPDPTSSRCGADTGPEALWSLPGSPDYRRIIEHILGEAWGRKDIMVIVSWLTPRCSSITLAVCTEMGCVGNP